jgi:hypothetical protein
MEVNSAERGRERLEILLVTFVPYEEEESMKVEMDIFGYICSGETFE